MEVRSTMASTMPTRVDAELFRSAKEAGHRQSRSAAQQIGHWARIGLQLELARTVSQRDIEAVLDGEGDYDDLNAFEQAVVRAGWREAVDARREGLDLAESLAAEGRSYAELDEDGNVVVRDPSAPH